MLHSERNEKWRKRWSGRSPGAKVLVIAAVVVLVPAFIALFGAVTMWLWNWLMPTIFKLPEIGFWQAIGLLLLAHIFFKGGRAGRAGKAHWRRAKLRERMREDEPEAKTE
jgi:hypothetical protein